MAVTWSEVTCEVPQGGVVSPYHFVPHMFTRKTAFDNTMDIVYADDIGVSWAIPLIKSSSWIKGALKNIMDFTLLSKIQFPILYPCLTPPSTLIIFV